MGQSNIQPDNQPKKTPQKLSPAQLQKIRNKKVNPKSDTSGVAIIYKTMAQLMTLVSTCQDVAPVAGSKGVVAAAPVVANKSDPAQSIGALVQAMQSQEFTTSPNSFYQKVFLATMDSSEIDAPAIKTLVTENLQSLFAPCLSDSTSRKDFALSMANAYSQLSNKSQNTIVLQMCLSLVVGPDHSLVDAVLKTYKNCVTTHNEIPNIKKVQKQIAATLAPFQAWNEQYCSLMEGLNKGKLAIQKIVGVVESAPKDATHQMNVLARLIKPLIVHSDYQQQMSQLLMQHFSKAAVNNPQKAFFAFMEKLQLSLPADCKQGCEAIIKHGQNQKVVLSNPDAQSTQAYIVKPGGGEKAFHNWVHDVIHNEPIMMAMYILLMSGSGSYGFLAKIMANLGVSMADIKKFVNDMKAIQDDINDLMTNKDPAEQAKDAADISAKQADLNGLIKTYGSKLGPELIKSLNSFANPGGSLDKVISEATAGKYTNWSDIAKDPSALKDVQKYLTGAGGGSAPSGVTTVFKNMSDLMGSLNTQNQADVEKLNLTTKKVDSLTKLFAASITMYKGLNQTLTNFSGS